MKQDMKKWLSEQLSHGPKKGLPVLSFPGIQMMNVTVKDLVSDAELQAQCMELVAKRTPSAAAVSLMDLSVEAECFGSNVRYSDDEIPTVVGALVTSEEEAEALAVPAVGSGRSGVCIEGIRKAAQRITDRPLFAGVTGPFSMAGRMMDVSEALANCYDEPDMVHILLQKATDFLIPYIQAFKEAGADGVVMAEPLAGLLSPSLAQEFAGDYCKKIVDAVQDDDFIVIYHNCGNTALMTIDAILSCGAKAYHFGNAINMAEMMPHIPADRVAMGNVDPAREFRNGTPESVRAATLSVMEDCCKYDNFVISSGCDIPPMSQWENIDAFFKAVDEFYAKA